MLTKVISSRTPSHSYESKEMEKTMDGHKKRKGKLKLLPINYLLVLFRDQSNVRLKKGLRLQNSSGGESVLDTRHDEGLFRSGTKIGFDFTAISVICR